jgi:hypothetical protein
MTLPSTQSNTFLDVLVGALKRSSAFDKNTQVQPAAIIWTDKERLWKPLLPLLRSKLPILTMGNYDPERHTGPSYWLLCMLARSIEEDVLPADDVPIIYLPDVSRSELRAIEECSQTIKPLAELQYRGVLWTQKNGHDWTPFAFIQSSNGGLGIDIAADQETKDALARSLLKLTDVTIENLRKQAPIKAAFLNGIVVQDIIDSILLWLSNPSEFKLKLSQEEWQALCSETKSKYGLDLEKDSTISGAQLLGSQEGEWEKVWARFKASPNLYPGIPSLLRNACPLQGALLDLQETWPQHNEYAEDQLRIDLTALSTQPPVEAREIILNLEYKNAERRSWVWAKLGRSRMAAAIEPLAKIAELTMQALTGEDTKAILQEYLDWGWHVDEAAVRALVLAQSPGCKADEIQAVKTAIRSVYKPWLEEANNAFQKAISTGPFTQSYPYLPLTMPEKGTCLLFSDALRMDAGQRLADAIKAEQYDVVVSARLTTLPPITMTAKPALCPDPDLLSGVGMSSLVPAATGKGTPITADGFRKILQGLGFHTLSSDDLGDPNGIAWTEMGEIDAYGHEHNCKLAIHLNDELSILQNRITSLIDYGWKKVVVVTDHGWLLLPGGLPKADLPEHLTEIRKGRCARMKAGAVTDQQTVPWYWDGTVRIAMAPGICCYESGKEYEHGGLSPQECITPMLIVMKSKSKPENVTIENVVWHGLRLTAQIIGAQAGMTVDIRTKSGDPKSSLVAMPKSPGEDGVVSLLIEDEDRMDTAVFIVVLDDAGTLKAQIMTKIGK